MLVTAILLAFVAAIIQGVWGIRPPWDKIVLAGILVIFVIGLVQAIAPGALSFGRV